MRQDLFFGKEDIIDEHEQKTKSHRVSIRMNALDGLSFFHFTFSAHIKANCIIITMCTDAFIFLYFCSSFSSFFFETIQGS